MALNHDSYRIGWICALPIEMAAARILFDERHPSLPQPPTDTNSYALGKIQSHNVVMACLPSGVYGTTSAAVVAKQMSTTFPGLSFGLMVGIGGGVPLISRSSSDVRLGDVVVGIPQNSLGGVVAYDYGKTIADGNFLRTGSLNHPPWSLLTAVSNIRSLYLLGQGRIGDILNQIIAECPDFRSPGPDHDQLLDASSDPDLPVDKRPVKQRPTRSSDAPHVHYGTIASGNRLIKHAKTRDELAAKYDILCFEMEAAGLMDLEHFPCLVIRGISDYADEFKAKEWQPYAAAAAAAYTKELISMIPRDQLREEARNSVSDTPSAEACATSSSIPYGLLHQVFPVEDNFLGSLTTNALWPRQNFHALPAPPSQSQFIVNVQQRSHTIKISVASHTSFSAIVDSKRRGDPDVDRTIRVDRSSSCMLKNSNDWFEEMCTRRNTRKWMEKQLIRSSERIYLVVGFRSLWHRDISLIQADSHNGSNSLPCLGEAVYAVQYREVKFRWFRRRDVDAARLQRRNCWQSLFTDRGDESDDEVENYLEATLNEDIGEASTTEVPHT
ncbi:hypothetical protein AnigIFM60653_003091 [Aspergillus niger]|nr:hypothetical protein AnigIFM60653_003091 [Aspergillus niger]